MSLIHAQSSIQTIIQACLGADQHEKDEKCVPTNSVILTVLGLENGD